MRGCNVTCIVGTNVAEFKKKTIYLMFVLLERGNKKFHGFDIPTKLPLCSRDIAQRKAPTSGLS